VLTALDASAIHRWCQTSLEMLGQAREEIDALNVYPVADRDTGTNLFLTMESAVQALSFPEDAPSTNDRDDPSKELAAVTRAMVHGALMGARGSSGTILSQLLRGMAEVISAPGQAAPFLDPGNLTEDATDSAAGDTLSGAPPLVDGVVLRQALRRAVELGYTAVARPVEGTILTVAQAAVSGAEATRSTELAGVARAAAQGAWAALERTPSQLEVLRQAGVVDAGGRGLCVVLDALVAVVTEAMILPVARAALPSPQSLPSQQGGPAFEVIYLLDAPESAVPALKEALLDLGDSLVVGGDEGLWHVHVHVDDVGSAIEAGLVVGRPRHIRVTSLGLAAEQRQAHTARPARSVVSIAVSAGLAALFSRAGATVLRSEPDRQPTAAQLVAAIRRMHAAEVLILPNDPKARVVAEVAARQARNEGVRVAVIPTKAAVQAIAALAVFEPGRRFEDDVIAMTSAAGATRCGALTVASSQAWTTAGVCQAGDVLGLIEGDVAVIGGELTVTGITVVERMLSGGGEMVTLITGEALVSAGGRPPYPGQQPADLARHVADHLHATRPEVDTVIYDGGLVGYPLLVGVE